METPLFTGLDAQLQSVLQVVCAQKAPAWTLMTEREGLQFRLEICWQNDPDNDAGDSAVQPIYTPSSDACGEKQRHILGLKCADGHCESLDHHLPQRTKNIKKKKSPATKRRDKRRLLKWLQERTNSKSCTPVPDSSFTPQSTTVCASIHKESEESTVSDSTHCSADDSDHTYDYRTWMSLPTVSLCFSTTVPDILDQSTNFCKKPTPVNDSDRIRRIKKGQKLLREWQLQVRQKQRSHGDSLCRN